MVMISMVIPIYNVGNKIKKIIKTLNENIILRKYFEIVFIDDGSRLNEEKIIKDNSKFNYLYYKKENEGALSARILGSKKSKGKYIWFVDPDDDIQINEKLFKRLNDLILDDYDVIFFNMEEIFSNRQNTIKLFPNENIKLKNYLFNASFRSCSLCDKIIKKDIILDKDFDVNFKGYHEDTLLWFQILSKIKKVSYINETLYKYYRFDSEDQLDSAITQMQKDRKLHEEYMVAVLNKIFLYYDNKKEKLYKNKRFILNVINHYIISDLFFTRRNFHKEYNNYKKNIQMLFREYKFMKKKMPVVWSIYYLNYLIKKFF